MRPLTPKLEKQLSEMKKLHEEGLTVTQIKDKLQLSGSMAYRLAGIAGIPTKRNPRLKSKVIVHDESPTERKPYTRRNLKTSDKCVVIVTNAASLKSIMNEVF